MVCAPVRPIIPSPKLGDYFSVQAHKPCSLNCSMADRISFDCTNTEEGLRNWTLTSRLWKLDSGLHAPPT